MVELFPYDLLVIATHCGDVSGYRWTYEYIDSEGQHRTLVVDIAVGVGQTDDKDMLHVSQFIRFISLDGVDWNDSEKWKKIHVGKAIIDFMEQKRQRKEMEPVKKEDVARVIGSAALKMADSNYLPFSRSLAGEGTPIIINNACVSWHRLVTNFVFAGARAYIGTMFPVVTSEAEAVLVRVLGKHFGKPLAGAVWAAQREVYGNSNRRPYVVCGVYPQRLRTTRGDIPEYIKRQLRRGLRSWQQFLTNIDRADTNKQRTVSDFVKYYERELKSFRDR